MPCPCTNYRKCCQSLHVCSTLRSDQRSSAELLYEHAQALSAKAPGLRRSGALCPEDFGRQGCVVCQQQRLAFGGPGCRSQQRNLPLCPARQLCEQRDPVADILDRSTVVLKDGSLRLEEVERVVGQVQLPCKCIVDHALLVHFICKPVPCLLHVENWRANLRWQVSHATESLIQAGQAAVNAR
eukprot:TRINITY_DN7010_c0_g1_i2.p1 TRINITY_DN7010_c0_g1~~TRINITY_DN7010_c0_g1_i2.p1  ORF type:complete len:184 (-),score=6.15 TRINITY_DN7010_c0_g1_i2:429-980(-)